MCAKFGYFFPFSAAEIVMKVMKFSLFLTNFQNSPFLFYYNAVMSGKKINFLIFSFFSLRNCDFFNVSINENLFPDPENLSKSG